MKGSILQCHLSHSQNKHDTKGEKFVSPLSMIMMMVVVMVVVVGHNIYCYCFHLSLHAYKHTHTMHKAKLDVFCAEKKILLVE